MTQANPESLKTLHYEVVELVNKKNEPYKILRLYYLTADGELVLIHDVFLRESLESIIKVLERLDKKSV